MGSSPDGPVLARPSARGMTGLGWDADILLVSVVRWESPVSSTDVRPFCIGNLGGGSIGQLPTGRSQCPSRQGAFRLWTTSTGVEDLVAAPSYGPPRRVELVAARARWNTQMEWHALTWEKLREYAEILTAMDVMPDLEFHAEPGASCAAVAEIQRTMSSACTGEHIHNCSQLAAADWQRLERSQREWEQLKKRKGRNPDVRYGVES